MVSVLIPAYRHQAFIAEAIDSVLSQSLTDLELIVVDDGSPDDTAKVAESALQHDPRARLIRQPNGGSHAAINRGLSLARGEWIAILNSDDRFHRNRLDVLLREASHDFDFLVTDFRVIDRAGKVVDDPGHWLVSMLDGFRDYAEAAGALDGLLYGNYTGSTSNFFFRRKLTEAIGGFRPYRYVIDWEFAQRAALHAPRRYRYLSGQVLLDYRLHGDNTILAGALEGALEINQMHAEILRDHYQVPRALRAAIHRNRRHLRRHWRELGEQRIEGFVRAREADLAEARQAYALEAETRQQERAVLDDKLRQLYRERERLEGQLAAREAELAAREAELTAVYASRSWRYTKILRNS